MDIALGSVHELEYACLLALDLDFITKEREAKLDIHLNEVKAKLINLIKSIRR
ncbi:four helix bundle protein [Terrimonas rubra]|uniref:Four helix bundle protein n=1 Tax=Terrimonas rubra TaxID=1035890 RepID=A0ABW5ZZA3_9BACT